LLALLNELYLAPQSNKILFLVILNLFRDYRTLRLDYPPFPLNSAFIPLAADLCLSHYLLAFL